MSNLSLLQYVLVSSWHKGKQIIPIISVAAFYILGDVYNFCPGCLPFHLSNASWDLLMGSLELATGVHGSKNYY